MNNMATSDKDKRKRKEEHSRKYARPFADNRPFEFEDGEGNLVRRTKEDAFMLVGKAYFFFDSEAPKDKITSELNRVRRHPSYSERLELFLIEGPENLRGYWDLMALAAKPRQAARRYVLEGNHLDAANREVAEELKDVMISTSPLILDEKGLFRGNIYYKENGEYTVLKERKTF